MKGWILLDQENPRWIQVNSICAVIQTHNGSSIATQTEFYFTITPVAEIMVKIEEASK